MNNIGADQTVQMGRMVCDFVVPLQQSDFSSRDKLNVMHVRNVGVWVAIITSGNRITTGSTMHVILMRTLCTY